MAQALDRSCARHGACLGIVCLVAVLAACGNSRETPHQASSMAECNRCHGGPDNAAPAVVVAKREFAGNWEYLLDQAIFTAPPHPTWSGAALLNHEGKLVGIGSLIVGDATGKGERQPGNMFVPTDLLAPILADLIVSGRTAGAGRPWLGLNTDEMHGHLMVSNVTPGGPAEHAGLKRGDIILGVNGETVSHLPEFYRMLYAQGDAGTMIPLDVFRDNEKQRIEVKSINRLDHLRLRSSF